MNSYHVLELVGEGSFGRVYKGRKKFSGQVVALKFMPKLGRSEKELRNLKREIEIMRDLQHPNIVQLFDSFETDSEVVVVTEYAEGQLFQILEDDGNLPENQVREIACQLVSALYYLHSHRILHRDMKPQNILLEKSGVVKLCDFGFARAMSVSTLVLTSIKGTPLYMSPELVEEKPYDHTADLWSLGCILYELHTGAPPFYTNSIFHLVQLIVKDTVKWPNTMSDTCTSFLKGLLTKDPLKRLSWPDLLHHPFVSDGVLVLSDTGVFSPLTVPPSPDMMALKLKQVAEKSLPASGESRLLRKAREQRNNKGKSEGSESGKKNKEGVRNGRPKSAAATMSPTAGTTKPPSDDVSVGQFYGSASSPDLKIQPSKTSKHGGQISRDYEQEFPSIEVGPRLVRRHSEESHCVLLRQDFDSEEYWENLAHKSDPSRQQKELNYTVIVPQLRSKILAFKAQLTGGAVEEVQQILQPLKVLHNLILVLDLEKWHHIGRELELPHVLFDLIHNTIENSDLIKHQWFVPALGEMMTVLMVYWEKHSDWMEEEHRLEEFTKPFNAILSQPHQRALAPLAASVLSLFVQHDVDVKVDMETLASLLKEQVSFETQISSPSGWGLCDGLFSLLLHTLSEHENVSVSSSKNPALFLDLWKKIASSLETPDMNFCSTDGLYSFLSAVLLVLTKDPYSCIPLFSEDGSKCVYTLGWLLGSNGLHLFAKESPGRPELNLNHDTLSALSCHLLCFPFALDLPSHTMSTILQLYDTCGIVASLLQVIQTLPPALLELPLSLLSRLLLCDPECSVSHLRKAAVGFFSPPQPSHLTASRHQTPLSRTASSLLSDLLQLDALWDSAAELLTLLSQVARFTALSAGFQLCIEALVLQRALTHSNDQIRVGTCRLLGNLDPFRPPTPDIIHIFKRMIECLNDSHIPVRRTACRAVGNWLGHIATETGFKMSKEKDQSQNKSSCINAADDLPIIIEERVDEEEGKRWIEEARKTVASLAPLITDSDAQTRRHCCAALGNLAHIDGTVALLLEKDVPSLLLTTACTDSRNAVREAAIATLCLYSKQDAIRQVLNSLNANKKLVQASQQGPSLRDYHQLIQLL